MFKDKEKPDNKTHTRDKCSSNFRVSVCDQVRLTLTNLFGCKWIEKTYQQACGSNPDSVRIFFMSSEDSMMILHIISIYVKFGSEPN
jgi:hypothetical protein